MSRFSSSRMRFHFKNPPIVEAVIAFNVGVLPEAALAGIQSCIDPMRSLGYSRVEPVLQLQVAIKFENGESSSENSRGSQLGTKFTSDDERYAVQFNRTGFVFSRLGRYESWEQFRDEAQKLWSVYSQALESPQVASLAVRYINKLFIPTNEMVEDYVTVWPHLPDGNQRIDNMFMQLGLMISDPEGKLIHTQMILPQEKPEFATLLFDNDFQFATDSKTVAQVWDMLERVRDLKNEYFERFTTPKMRESFNA